MTFPGLFSKLFFGRGNHGADLGYDLPEIDNPLVEIYPVQIYDDSLDLIAEYLDYSSLRWSRRWRTPGNFSLKINRYNADGSERDLQQDYYVGLFRGGVQRIGKIMTREISVESGMADEFWILDGLDGKGELGQRQTIAGIGTGTGFDVQSAVSAEAACRHYIDRNAINALDAAGASDTDRIIDEIALETFHSPEIGGTVSYQSRLETLTTPIEQILLASPTGIGYDSVFLPVTKKIEIQFKAGSDKSWVQYSSALGNIKVIQYRESAENKVNFVYVGGTGTLAARTFVNLPASSAPTGRDRYEGFIDGSNTDNSTAQLTALGNAELAGKSSSESITFEIIEDNSFSYLSRLAAGDYDIGDIITVTYAGIATLSGRITGIDEQLGNGVSGHNIIRIGNEKSDLTTIMKAVNERGAKGGRK